MTLSELSFAVLFASGTSALVKTLSLTLYNGGMLNMQEAAVSVDN
jgi:hypothetical protein